MPFWTSIKIASPPIARIPSSSARAGSFAIVQKFYRKKLLKGISPEEQAAILEHVVAKYKAVGVDVSVLERDLKKMTVKVSSEKSDYEMSIKYYKLMVERGATVAQRKAILEKLIQKYNDRGVDTTILKNALKKLTDK